MQYRLKLSYHCGCSRPSWVGHIFLGYSFIDINVAHKDMTTWNFHTNSTTSCKCRVEVVEVNE